MKEPTLPENEYPGLKFVPVAFDAADESVRAVSAAELPTMDILTDPPYVLLKLVSSGQVTWMKLRGYCLRLAKNSTSLYALVPFQDTEQWKSSQAKWEETWREDVKQFTDEHTGFSAKDLIQGAPGGDIITPKADDESAEKPQTSTKKGSSKKK